VFAALGLLLPAALATEITPNGTTVATGARIGVQGQHSYGEWLLDNGSIPNGSGRTVSGDNVAGGWTVFQPFTVPEPGWIVETIGVDGWNVQDPMGLGMLGSLLPSDVNGDPDEDSPIASAVYYLSPDPFSSNWRDEPFNVVLEPGRYWMKWEDNGDPNHWSAIFAGITGENSHSRQETTGRIVEDGITALRIWGTVVPEPSTLLLLLGAGALLRRR